MVIVENLIRRIDEQLKKLPLVRLPASEEEYLDITKELPYKAEYHQSEIITMGLSSIWHEVIIMNLGAFLHTLFLKNDDFLLMGSNAGVHLPKFEGGYYMPDILVVKDTPVFKPNSNCILTNPYLIIEVLLPATMSFDISAKLEEYKEFESLQQIVYVYQDRPKVISYTRTEMPNTWLNQDYKKMEDALVMAGHSIPLSEIYRKVSFS
ncbi:MAG: Uma2 family endonuclease [Runella sp.]